MPEVTYRLLDGRSESVSVVAGTSVMRAALMNGIPGIVGECGGQAMCATCHVYVHDDYLGGLPPMSDDEFEMLEETAAPRDETRSRLGCQLKLGAEIDSIVVDIPEEQ